MVLNINMIFTYVALDNSCDTQCSLWYRATHWVVGLSPYWYHLGNIALHSLVCSLFCRLLTRQMPPAAALTPALIFATHPIHTEAVSTGGCCVQCSACGVCSLIHPEAVSTGGCCVQCSACGVRRLIQLSIHATLHHARINIHWQKSYNKNEYI